MFNLAELDIIERSLDCFINDCSYKTARAKEMSEYWRGKIGEDALLQQDRHEALMSDAKKVREKLFDLQEQIYRIYE
ncbi:MAG: hypothetical protein WCO84_01145 [bacterium]